MAPGIVECRVIILDKRGVKQCLLFKTIFLRQFVILYWLKYNKYYSRRILEIENLNRFKWLIFSRRE